LELHPEQVTLAKPAPAGEHFSDTAQIFRRNRFHKTGSQQGTVAYPAAGVAVALN
jgi:hypothetical protein